VAEAIAGIEMAVFPVPKAETRTKNGQFSSDHVNGKKPAQLPF